MYLLEKKKMPKHLMCIKKYKFLCIKYKTRQQRLIGSLVGIDTEPKHQKMGLEIFKFLCKLKKKLWTAAQFGILCVRLAESLWNNISAGECILYNYIHMKANGKKTSSKVEYLRFFFLQFNFFLILFYKKFHSFLP